MSELGRRDWMMRAAMNAAEAGQALERRALAFWFDNIDLCVQATGGGEGARTLASQMSRALVAFARTGDPNHDGIPKWAPFSEGNRAMMIWDTTSEVRIDPDREARQALTPA